MGSRCHGRRRVRRVHHVQRVPPETGITALAPPAPATTGVPAAGRHDGLCASRPHGHAPPSPAPRHGHAPAPPHRTRPDATGPADPDRRRPAGHVSDAGHRVRRSRAAARRYRQRQRRRRRCRPETHQIGNGLQLATGHRPTTAVG